MEVKRRSVSLNAYHTIKKDRESERAITFFKLFRDLILGEVKRAVTFPVGYLRERIPNRK